MEDIWYVYEQIQLASAVNLPVCGVMTGSMAIGGWGNCCGNVHCQFFYNFIKWRFFLNLLVVGLEFEILGYKIAESLWYLNHDKVNENRCFVEGSQAPTHCI